MDKNLDTSISNNVEKEQLLKKIKKNRRKKFWQKHKYKLIISAILVIILITTFLVVKICYYDLYKVKSVNMSTTIEYGDSVLIKKNIDEIKVGNIYKFVKDDKEMIGRCIASGGDYVKISNDKVYINSVLLGEDYVSSKPDEKISVNILVPENKYLFLGDNRKESWDARYWSEKFVDRKDIIGQVTKIVFPLDRSKELN